MLPEITGGGEVAKINPSSHHAFTQPCYKYANITPKINTGEKFPSIEKNQYTVTITTSGRVISRGVRPQSGLDKLRAFIEKDDPKRFQSCFARFQPATTTQGAPYSSSDLIGSYNNDTRLASTEDLRLTNGPYTDRVDKRPTKIQGKDTTEGRPSSKKNNNTIKIINTKVLSADKEKDKEREKDNRDRHKEPKDLEGIGGGGGGGSAGGPILPPTSNKLSHSNYSNFRPMNARNNFLGGQQINPLPSQQRCSTQQSANNGSSLSRESEDLVAMGTNPLYGRGRLREGSFTNGNGVYYSQSSSGALGSVRKFSKPNAFTRSKDAEPKYADPLLNAPPTFNQRLAEITSLEQETIRYERTKKFRKKKSETT